MKTQHLLASIVLVWVGLCSLVQAQTPPVAPRRQSLAVPIITAPPGPQPVRSLECVVPFGPPVALAAVAFRPDGKLLAVGAYQEVLLWDLAEAKLLKRLGVGQLSDAVHALAFHKDGKLLAVAEGAAHGPGAVKLFDVESGQLAAEFKEPKDATYCLTFSPDGKLLAGGGVDSVVHVWNVEEKKQVAGIQGHDGWIASVCFGADGKLLSSAADRTALVWEVGSFNRVASLQETDQVQGVAFSPDGQLVALAVAGATDKLIRIRRRDNGQLVRPIDLGVASPLDVLWTAQGNRLWVPCSDKTIKVYDAGNGGMVANLQGHAGWVYRAAPSPDGTKLASASADGTVKLWLPAESRLLATLVQLAPRTEQWLIFTPPGYLATSAPGELQWKAAGLTTPPDKLPGIFQNADLVKQAIAGGKIAPPAVP